MVLPGVTVTCFSNWAYPSIWALIVYTPTGTPWEDIATGGVGHLLYLGAVDHDMGVVEGLACGGPRDHPGHDAGLRGKAARSQHAERESEGQDLAAGAVAIGHGTTPFRRVNGVLAGRSPPPTGGSADTLIVRTLSARRKSDLAQEHPHETGARGPTSPTRPRRPLDCAGDCRLHVSGLDRRAHVRASSVDSAKTLSINILRATWNPNGRPIRTSAAGPAPRVGVSIHVSIPHTQTCRKR